MAFQINSIDMMRLFSLVPIKFIITDTMRITDGNNKPCDIKLKSGNYTIGVMFKKIPKFGHRMMSILIVKISPEYKDYYMWNFELSCKVGVDNGLIGIFNKNKKINISLPSNKGIDYTKNSIIMRSGLGDGLYDVYCLKYSNDNV